MARDILSSFEFGDGGRHGGKSGGRASSKYDVAGDVFFGKDDMKEYVWDGVFTEKTVRFLERESAMKTLRKRSEKKIRQEDTTFRCFEFLKFPWCFKF